MRYKSLEKRAMEVILEQMEDVSVLDTESVMELMRPHFSPDISALREQALRRKANQLISKFKDEKGIRVWYAFKDDEGKSKYANVDTTKDINVMKRVKSQIDKKSNGLNATRKKVNHRMKVLYGQMSFEDLKKEGN